jgi:hypothetical protein
MSRYPIEYEGSDNLYAFCIQDPINAADPDGTDWYYSPKTGRLWRFDQMHPGLGWHGIQYFGAGYSGAKDPEYRNNPDADVDRLHVMSEDPKDWPKHKSKPKYKHKPRHQRPRR